MADDQQDTAGTGHDAGRDDRTVQERFRERVEQEEKRREMQQATEKSADEPEWRARLRQINIRLSLYALLPDIYTDHIETHARHARIVGYRRTTSTILMIYWVVVLAALPVVQLPVLQSVLAFAGAAPVGFIIPYAFYVVMAERRKKEIERVLPDALLLMSANIESGLTVDKAFLLSARDEFGPLADDIRRTAMKMFGGKPVEDALLELAEETNSPLFEETLKLLIDGINSGGEVSSLLESSADDIRKSLHLREEIAANVKMYSMFILFASMLGAPLLFGVSTYLAQTTQEMWSSQAGGVDMENLPDTGPFDFQAPSFDVEFFRMFAVASLIISNAFAALIISEIKNGNVKAGFKLIPVFVIIAVVVFFVVDVVIQNTLGTMI
jgi:Flp pilus assembly protein TadB